LDKAKYWLDETAKNGVRYINLSGGETICYPHIYKVTEYASGLGMEVNIAVSGYHFGEKEIRRFAGAGAYPWLEEELIQRLQKNMDIEIVR
jgi:pyrroloquinoline quinone biosynthesis protein E